MVKSKAQVGIAEMQEAALPAVELARFRLWLLEKTDTDSAAAETIGIQVQTLYRAKQGKKLSARNLHRIMKFINALPEVAQ